MVFGREVVGEINPSDIDVMFNTNVLGLIALTQQFVPKFKARGSGDIVNLGSIAGLEGYPNGSIYCATKAALRSFTHSLRKETIDTKIRVMEVQPGAVETEFSSMFDIFDFIYSRSFANTECLVVRNRGDKAKADAVYAGTEPLVAEDIAEIIVFGLTRRQNTVVADTLVFPSHQASASHIHRDM